MSGGRGAEGGRGIEVRVVPRAGSRGVMLDGGEIVVRVPSPPEGGRATEDARRTLAEALGVPASRVRLLRGTRSRRKAFEVAGMKAEEAVVRLRG